MGIYSGNINESSGFGRNIDLGFDLDDIQESSLEPNMEAGFIIMAESEENYNKIMKAVGISELAYYEANGEEMVYEAVDFRGFFAKIKDFFMNLLKKVAALVKKFLALFDSWTKSDKSFVNKYRKELNLASTSDFTFKGYEFKNVESTTISSNSTSMGTKLDTELGLKLEDFRVAAILTQAKCKGLIEKVSENKEDIMDNIRGAAIGQSSGVASGDLYKELFMYFRDGEESKTEINSVNTQSIMKTIEDTSKDKTTIKAAYKIAEKEVKDIIKALNDVEKGFTKDLKSETPLKTEPADEETATKAVQLQAVSKAIECQKERLTILQSLNTALMTALKDRNRQSKAICVALIGRRQKGGKTVYESSQSYDNDYSLGSFLDNVVLK